VLVVNSSISPIVRCIVKCNPDSNTNTTDVASQFVFHPIPEEVTHGPINESARDLLRHVGKRISTHLGDNREICFLFQRFSVVVQRFNSVLLHDSFCVEDQLVTPSTYLHNF